MIRNNSIRARPSPRHTRGPKKWKKLSFKKGHPINHYFAFHRGSHVPAEKGMKASTLTNSPFSLRKFSGLNSCGNFQCFSSFRTDDRFGIIIVPWVGKTKHNAGQTVLFFLVFLLTSYTSYLGNGITVKLCVVSRTVEDAEWNGVGHPLWLMNDSLNAETDKKSLRLQAKHFYYLQMMRLSSNLFGFYLLRIMKYSPLYCYWSWLPACRASGFCRWTWTQSSLPTLCLSPADIALRDEV